MIRKGVHYQEYNGGNSNQMLLLQLQQHQQQNQQLSQQQFNDSSSNDIYNKSGIRTLRESLGDRDPSAN